MKNRKRILTFVLALACIALGGYVVVEWPRLTREPVGLPENELPLSVEGARVVIDGQFVGHDVDSILMRFGPPTHRWQGHYGVPWLSYQRKYSDAITATYIRPAGILYLSFCQEGGRLVCFSSHWMPEGAVF